MVSVCFCGVDAATLTSGVEKRSEESARVLREAALSRCGCFYAIFHARLEHTEQVMGGEGGRKAHRGGPQETPRRSVAFFAAFLEGLVDLDLFFVFFMSEFPILPL